MIQIIREFSAEHWGFDDPKPTDVIPLTDALCRDIHNGGCVFPPGKIRAMLTEGEAVQSRNCRYYRVDAALTTNDDPEPPMDAWHCIGGDGCACLTIFIDPEAMRTCINARVEPERAVAP